MGKSSCTIAGLEERESAALDRMIPFVEPYPEWEAKNHRRRHLVRFRSLLVRAAVESFEDGGRAVVVKIGYGAGRGEVRVRVEPMGTVPSAELEEVMALPDATEVEDDEDDD